MVAFGGQQEINRVAFGVDRTIKIFPLATHLDVGVRALRLLRKRSPSLHAPTFPGPPASLLEFVREQRREFAKSGIGQRWIVE